MTPTRILLTGASGNVGYEVLKQLVALGDKYEVSIFDLRNKKTEELFEPFKNDVFIHYGDITREMDVDEACSDKDYVIHLAALIPPAADEKTDLAHRINVQGTANLVKALERHSPNAFLAYSSSVSVYGDRVNSPNINVGDELNPSIGDYYATTKVAAESIVRNSKLAWTIFRLSAIMGADNHKISPLMFHMPLETPIEITTPEDTARAFVNAAEKRNELQGRIFNLGGGEACRITYRRLLEENFRIFGLGKLNPPAHTFATANFHCGYYADGDDLENILLFRRDTIDSYLKLVESKVSSFQRNMTKLVAPLAKRILFSRSEPRQAIKENDTEKINQFFRGVVPPKTK